MASLSSIIAIAIIPAPEDGGYNAELLGLPAVGEGLTHEHAVWNLCEAIDDYLQARGTADAIARLRTWMDSGRTDATA
jgi:hypothetical protein